MVPCNQLHQVLCGSLLKRCFCLYQRYDERSPALAPYGQAVVWDRPPSGAANVFTSFHHPHQPPAVVVKAADAAKEAAGASRVLVCEFIAHLQIQSRPAPCAAGAH